MERHRRLVVIIVSVGLASLCGWLMIGSLKHDCYNLPLAQCRLLVGTAIASIVGGALFTEVLIKRRQARGEWRLRAQDLRGEGPILSRRQVWLRSIVRVAVASLLTGLPLIVKGAIGLTVLGAIVGLSLALLMRGIMNWLPPVEEDNKS